MGIIEKAEIKNAQINSDTYINLLANSISVSWEIFTNVKGTPTRSLADSFDSRLGRGIYTGFNNPLITIQGNFKINEGHVTGSDATLDYEYLKDMAERGDVVMTLKCNLFKETGNTDGEISVMIKNISFGNSNSNIANYTLNLVEVNSSS